MNIKIVNTIKTVDEWIQFFNKSNAIFSQEENEILDLFMRRTTDNILSNYNEIIGNIGFNMVDGKFSPSTDIFSYTGRLRYFILEDECTSIKKCFNSIIKRNMLKQCIGSSDDIKLLFKDINTHYKSFPNHVRYINDDGIESSFPLKDILNSSIYHNDVDKSKYDLDEYRMLIPIMCANIIDTIFYCFNIIVILDMCGLIQLKKKYGFILTSQ